MTEAGHAVAVIVVTYNSGEVLEGCLTALDDALAAAQPRLRSAELIVVDNASATRPELTGGPQRTTRRRLLDENLGFAPAVNHALALVPDADRVLLLNPDTRLEATALELLLAAMDARGAALAGPLLVGADGRPHGRSERPFHSVAREAVTQFAPFLLRQPPYGREAARSGRARALTGACLLADGRFLRAVGGLDTALPMYLEDIELCWRAHAAGREVHLSRAARCGHALGGSSGGANFRASIGLHLTLLAARLEFLRRHRGTLAALAARACMCAGAAGRVAVARVTGRGALERKHRAALRWALRSGGRPPWPPESRADAR